MSKEARAMGKWGQSPIYTVSHDSQEIERSPFRVSEVEEVPCKRGFLGGREGGKNDRNQHALWRLNRPSLAQKPKTSL